MNSCLGCDITSARRQGVVKNAASAAARQERHAPEARNSACRWGGGGRFWGLVECLYRHLGSEPASCSVGVARSTEPQRAAHAKRHCCHHQPKAQRTKQRAPSETTPTASIAHPGLLVRPGPVHHPPEDDVQQRLGQVGPRREVGRGLVRQLPLLLLLCPGAVAVAAALAGEARGLGAIGADLRLRVAIGGAREASAGGRGAAHTRVTKAACGSASRLGVPTAAPNAPL